MKLYSWNVNGLRAVLNKGALQAFLAAEQPDVLCLQEIKCKPDQCNFDFAALGYNIFWNPADRPGYSGTAILTSKSIFSQHGEPSQKASDLPDFYNTLCVVKMKTAQICPRCEEIDFEGRLTIAEFEDFYLVNVYTPNSKPDLSRLKMREKEWDPEFLKYLKELEKAKPVITCGDFNAAHAEIDLARPKANHHSAGFTDEERQGITNLLNMGFTDTFRHQNPDVARYTWWSHWGHAREHNIGWRIDYFFVSKSITNNLKSAEIYEHYLGSDHCPISVEMEF